VVEVRRTIFNIHPALGCWRRVEVGFVADVLSEHIASIIRTSTPVLEIICSPETSAREPNSTRCQHPKTGPTVPTNHLESLKSVKPLFSKITVDLSLYFLFLLDVVSVFLS
jgi:hypothetical protein